jgi:hypothetical protein
MVHPPITEHIYITPSRMKWSYQRSYELLMAHAFFAILERELDFLTLVESAFPYKPIVCGVWEDGYLRVDLISGTLTSSLRR